MTVDWIELVRARAHSPQPNAAQGLEQGSVLLRLNGMIEASD